MVDQRSFVLCACSIGSAGLAGVDLLPLLDLLTAVLRFLVWGACAVGTSTISSSEDCSCCIVRLLITGGSPWSPVTLSTSSWRSESSTVRTELCDADELLSPEPGSGAVPLPLGICPSRNKLYYFVFNHHNNGVI